MKIRYIIFEPDSYDTNGNKNKEVIFDIMELPIVFNADKRLDKLGSEILHKVCMFKDNGYRIEVEFIGVD